MKKSKAQDKFESLIDRAFKNKFIDCFKQKKEQGELNYLTEIDSLFDEIDDVYHNREKYSIEWAFEDAQNKLNQFSDEIIEGQLKPKLLKHSNNEKLKDAFEELKILNKGLKKKTKWYSRLFSNVYLLISMVEIVISLILVIGLSHVSHSGDVFINSAALSVLFVGTVAFLKVTLEKYLVKPKIDRWGWGLYIRSSKKLRRMIAILLFTNEGMLEMIDKATEPVLDNQMQELKLVNG
ncbi:hypothetical protein R9X47_12055 [Wukongibacter baidiensis]|uniref:hypothetical protein n=1 Tax=Wukongibacter baidiensis TaxID=1723361 RepID=UPI003D7F8344